MVIYVLVNEDGSVDGWGSSRGSDVEIEIEIPDNHQFISAIPSDYIIVDGQLVMSEELALANAKVKKNSELSRKCNTAILAGFEHTINDQVYWFNYDMEAQGNFRDAKEMLSDGVVSELPWTVRIHDSTGEYSRVLVSLDIIKDLSIVIMQHKTEKISKYRDYLMPIVNGSTTVEEVEEVMW